MGMFSRLSDHQNAGFFGDSLYLYPSLTKFTDIDDIGLVKPR